MYVIKKYVEGLAVINDDTGETKVAGLTNGQMEMGFLFDDTDLAPLGHFDLV